MHVHLIGIGGAGLSAIAKVLLDKGYTVSGSDKQTTPFIQGLIHEGARVFTGHRPENIAGADIILRSSAVNDENVEVRAALEAGIPLVKRADFMEKLIGDQDCIAIAGTHGKTTTTAMTGWLMESLGLDPSYIIGGQLINVGRNARAGNGQFFVIEADEYDHMFLGLKPKISIITNVEHDHPDQFPTYQDMLEEFKLFVGRLRPDGTLIASGEDPGAVAMLGFAEEFGHRSLSYGIESAEFDFRADAIVRNEHGGFDFSFTRRNAISLTRVKLQIPGMHNVRNALAVMALADILGLPLEDSAHALGEFSGIGRRFEVVGTAAGITVVSDYAHHPTEIRATLAAARMRFPDQKILAVWQPHTYSRTRLFWDEFIHAFEEADDVLITEIYAAREESPSGGFSARAFADSLGGKADFTGGLEETRLALKDRVEPGDIVMILSAGDADQLSSWLVADLSASIPDKSQAGAST